MTQAKLKQKTHQIFITFCCLPYHVPPASVGAMHMYICFYFVLGNNKQMAEQPYILQKISELYHYDFHVKIMKVKTF